MLLSRYTEEQCIPCSERGNHDDVHAYHRSTQHLLEADMEETHTFTFWCYNKSTEQRLSTFACDSESTVKNYKKRCLSWVIQFGRR